ncbi:hypothetical protein FRC10_010948 [Ceratobasidium sp. 414]|nr:hypothetical protein FRC10_010948 [Ceratobasidium sp. 414]
MNSPTPEFTLPPADGSTPPVLAIDFHLKHNPKHVFAVLYDVKSSTETSVTYEQLAHAVHRAAHILNPTAPISQGAKLGILASVDSITYITLVLGAMRAGLVPFPISPRIPPAGIAHLCTETKTSRVLIGGSPAILALGKAVKSAMSGVQQTLDYVQLPSVDDLYPHLGNPGTKFEGPFKPFTELKRAGDQSHVFVLHSSGSTGMPRPIVWDQEGMFKNLLTQPALLMYGKPPRTRVGMMAFPAFHIMVGRSYTVGAGVPKRSELLGNGPALSRTPVYRMYSGTFCSEQSSRHADSGPDTPSYYKYRVQTWSQDESSIAQLKELDFVTFGGGSLALHIGDKLAKQGQRPVFPPKMLIQFFLGVRLSCGYGATEFGAVINSYDPNDDPRDWPYVSFSSRADVRLDPQGDGEGSYEIVLLPTSTHKPYVLGSEFQRRPAYRTKDLVVPHPSNPNLWKLCAYILSNPETTSPTFRSVGRLDDQIVLLNGEKINPGPMAFTLEAEIVASPIVESAIIFGRERDHTGVLLELRGDNVKNQYESREGRAGLVDQIWPYVESASNASPTHARLARDAIILVDPSRPLPRTAKGTVSRSGALKSYAKEVDDMYAALEKGVALGATSGAPQSWRDFGLVQEWVAERVQDILGREIEIGVDLFHQGMDSLTATVLLRTLKGALYSDDLSTLASGLTPQVIFANPTVRQLSELLVQLCNLGDTTSPGDFRTSALDAIRSMINKYDSGWSTPKRSLEARTLPPKERVVVTGTTGALGSYLLAQVLANNQVEKVWALNRGSKDIMARQRASFEDKLLDVEALKNEKLALLEADLEDEKLGLEAGIYEEVSHDLDLNFWGDMVSLQIRSTATSIIHNAWKVNFNLTLQSFEPNIKGARNLLDLAFGSAAPTGTPRFLFTSSIAVAGIGKYDTGLKERYLEPEEVADGIGYGQGKFVVEKLLESARGAGLETCNVRLGQLTGDNVAGSWSTTDWVPSVIASSVSMRLVLTGVDLQSASWLPLDIAARCVVEICTARAEILPAVVQLSHPHPIRWSYIFGIFAEILKRRTGTAQALPLAPFSEWNKQVNAAASAPEESETDRYRRFPSMKFQSITDKMVRADDTSKSRRTETDVEAIGAARMDNSEAEVLCESLRNPPQLGKNDVEEWVSYWEKKGLFI